MTPEEQQNKAAQFLEERVMDAFTFGFTMGVRAGLPKDMAQADLYNVTRFAINEYYKTIKERAAVINAKPGGIPNTKARIKDIKK